MDITIIDKTILVTGGAGTIGTVLVKRLLDYPIKEIIVLDTNEYGLGQLGKDDRVKRILGSVLDYELLRDIIRDTDIIFHLAAVKDVDITETNPHQTVNTNINGIINILRLIRGSKVLVNVSTDKAVYPSTIYGKTKNIAEHLVLLAGFKTVRLANVMQTRGNVFDIWTTQQKQGFPLSLTDIEMKRYFIDIEDACDFIINSLSLKGRVFIPKMKLYNLIDFINIPYEIIGLRQDEKIEEKLMSDEEKKYCIELKDMWICPK